VTDCRRQTDGRTDRIAIAVSCVIVLTRDKKCIKCAYTCTVVGYTMDTVYFAWLENPVEIDDNVQFPQFKHIDSLLYDCSMNYTAGALYACLTHRPTDVASHDIMTSSVCAAGPPGS